MAHDSCVDFRSFIRDLSPDTKEINIQSIPLLSHSGGKFYNFLILLSNILMVRTVQHEVLPLNLLSIKLPTTT